MTLTTRLSLFFLGALAVVLVGFSAALYGLARHVLFVQVQEQGSAVLDTLAAAVEVEKDGLEWEPHERFFPFHKGKTPGFLWCVRDEQGHRLDGHGGDESLFSLTREDGNEVEVVWNKERHWLAWRRLRAKDKAVPHMESQDKTGERPRHRAVTLAVAIPLERVYSQLATIAFLLIGLSLGFWVGAAFLGRRLCRRALAPLTRMAHAARAIQSDDREQRLPSPLTCDELEDLGGAFNDLLGRLQESSERQKRFAGEASHQLRTPLTAMLGQVEVFLRRERTVEESQRVLSSVQKQAVKLRHIVEGLLFLARADAEARLPQGECLDLRAWLPEHLAHWRQHPRGADLHPTCQGENPLAVCVHSALLGQAVDNLLDNAMKYSEPETPIVIEVGRDGGDVFLAVEDRGCGVSPEEMPRLFDAFFRSPEARRRGISGVGLGLAVTRRIITAFGGQIQATSLPGRGSRFVIRLPARDAP